MAVRHAPEEIDPSPSQSSRKGKGPLSRLHFGSLNTIPFQPKIQPCQRYLTFLPYEWKSNSVLSFLHKNQANIYISFKPVLPTHSLSSKNDLLQSGNAWDILLNQVGPWADPTLAPRRWSLTRKVNAWAWVRRASPPLVFFLYGVYRVGPSIQKVCHYQLLYMSASLESSWCCDYHR